MVALVRALRSIVVVVVCGCAPLLAGCGKLCESAEGCKKSCNCTDQAQSVTFECAMTFNCDTKAGTCDPMHDKSCDEICTAFAAHDACGRQCSKDDHCLRQENCKDANGNVLVCRQAFLCDTKVGACEAAHGATTCGQICAACVASGTCATTTE